MTIENHIFSLCVDECGGATVDDHKYAEGEWNMLKRTSRAIEVCGCEPYELLLPIPMSELMFNPKITQNSGY